MCEFIPALGLVVGSDHEHGLGGFFMPEDAGALEAKVDDAADRAFHGAAADRQVQAARPGVAETVAVAKEVMAIVDAGLE